MGVYVWPPAGSVFVSSLNGLTGDLELISDDGSVTITPSGTEIDLSVNFPDLFAHQSTATPTGTTITVDWSLGNGITIDLGSATGTVTIDFSNGVDGRTYHVILIQGATPRQVIFNDALLTDGVDPQISTVNDSKHKFEFYFDGTDYFGPGNFSFA